eukprot:m.801443 g.801443  ORF g.801443 m.801443 type:complete len:90 (+) comp23359_c1_seq1:287-556(+)
MNIPPENTSLNGVLGRRIEVVAIRAPSPCEKTSGSSLRFLPLKGTAISDSKETISFQQCLNTEKKKYNAIRVHRVNTLEPHTVGIYKFH